MIIFEVGSCYLYISFYLDQYNIAHEGNFRIEDDYDGLQYDLSQVGLTTPNNTEQSVIQNPYYGDEIDCGVLNDDNEIELMNERNYSNKKKASCRKKTEEKLDCPKNKTKGQKNCENVTVIQNPYYE